MGPQALTLDNLPSLPLAEWEDTRLQLHLMAQIVGKVRLALHPPINHWWHVTLALSSRGLTTGAIPYRGSTFDAELDLVAHELVLRTCDRGSRTIPLAARPLAEFYRDVLEGLRELGIEVKLDGRPYKCASRVPFAEDRVHAAYDREAVGRAWTALRLIEPVMKEFRGRFVGKCSPVHLYWHSFDLAVGRFSGRRAPELAGADPVSREAYSHEVSSAGFWFGDAKVPEAAFYAYSAPAPEGLDSRPLEPREARWVDQGGSPLAFLRYEDVRRAADPRATLLAFFQSAYEAGADAARWDRAALEDPRRAG